MIDCLDVWSKWVILTYSILLNDSFSELDYTLGFYYAKFED